MLSRSTSRRCLAPPPPNPLPPLPRPDTETIRCCSTREWDVIEGAVRQLVAGISRGHPWQSSNGSTSHHTTLATSCRAITVGYQKRLLVLKFLTIPRTSCWSGERIFWRSWLLLPKDISQYFIRQFSAIIFIVVYGIRTTSFSLTHN